jgi:hypothetical protein
MMRYPPQYLHVSKPLRVVIGIDPGSSYTGLAMAANDQRDPALRLKRMVRQPMSEDIVASARKVVQVLLDWLASDVSDTETYDAVEVWIEQCPPTAREDVNHGQQGKIGFAQGRLVGLIEGMLSVHRGIRVRLVQVQDWRVTLKALSIALPPPPAAPAPSQRASAFDLTRSASGMIRTWKVCGHTDTVPFDKILVAAPTTCPACAQTQGKQRTRAEAVRDDWKHLACRFIGEAAPALYQAVVAQAEARAHVPHKAPWTLMGVPDACEAACIALHGLEVDFAE